MNFWPWPPTGLTSSFAPTQRWKWKVGAYVLDKSKIKAWCTFSLPQTFVLPARKNNFPIFLLMSLPNCVMVVCTVICSGEVWKYRRHSHLGRLLHAVTTSMSTSARVWMNQCHAFPRDNCLCQRCSNNDVCIASRKQWRQRVKSTVNESECDVWHWCRLSNSNRPSVWSRQSLSASLLL